MLSELNILSIDTDHATILDVNKSRCHPNLQDKVYTQNGTLEYDR